MAISLAIIITRIAVSLEDLRVEVVDVMACVGGGDGKVVWVEEM